MYSFEVLLYICSWLPSSVPRMMALISNTFGLFPPHDRVDVSHHVLNIPYYLPVHSEAEVAVALESCPEAIRELWRVVLDHHIPLNYVTEVRRRRRKRKRRKRRRRRRRRWRWGWKRRGREMNSRGRKREHNYGVLSTMNQLTCSQRLDTSFLPSRYVQCRLMTFG